MRFRDLDLNLIVVLDALLTEENVSRAAERLNLTQPAISNSLARLRRHFNDDLLVKYGRRMVATPLADRLRKPVREALMQMQLIADARPEFDPETADRVFYIVGSDYVTATLLAEAAVRLQDAAPGIGLVSLPMTDRNLEQFNRGEWDLLVAPEVNVVTGHHMSLLFRERFTCVAWSENTGIGSSVTLDEYLSLTHVVAAFDDPKMLSLDEFYLRQRGLKRKVAAVMQNYTLVPLFVVGTRFIATTHARLAERFRQSLPLKIVKPRISFPMVNEMLQWHRHRDRDPANLWLRNFLIEVAADL